MKLSHLKTVLHLEDEMMLVMDLEELMRAQGVAEVLHCATARAAIEIINTTPPDAAVVDAYVRDGDTQAVAALLRERGIPFIMLSGASDPFDNRTDAIWVNKPASDDDMIEALISATSSAIRQ